MPDIYRAADIFCLPSWWEAAPLSLLEAMATGLAVVASRVGDIPKIVEDGVSGLLVPPRDPSSLTEALKELCLDPERRTAMGLQARRTVVERFDAASMRADIDSLYQGVASGARSR
jgi:glycosyltransferase involved in cell wall biosynthesis